MSAPKPAALAAWSGPTLLLVDGTYFIFRAYHALPPLATRAGVATHAAYGFTTMLLKALREVQPSHVAVAFDSGGSTAREAIASSYKANRTAPPEDLVPQFGLAREVTAALRLPVLEQPGVEADDLLGTLARTAEREGFFTVLLAGDKDFMQIVDQRTILLDTMYDRWVGPGEVLAKTGVPPTQIVEYMALLGDAIDNVQGIPGVGPKTAAQLIQRFGSAEGLLAALELPPAPAEKVLKPKLRDKLRAHVDGIRLARRLVEIDTALPLPVTLEDLRRKEPDPAELRALFERLEFTRLARELPGTPAAASPVRAVEAGAVAGSVVGSASSAASLTKEALSFTTPGIALAAEPALAALAWFARASALGLHVELAAAGERPTEAVGMALAAGKAEDRRTLYLPLAHQTLGSRFPEAARAPLAALLADAQLPKIGFGLKQAATALRAAGLPLAGLRFDSELALYLIDPGRREHALVDLVPQRFTTTLPRVEALELSRRKVALSELDPEQVAPHAAASAEAALALEPILSGELRALGLWPLFAELELPLLSILAEMEWAGVRVDLPALAALSTEAQGQIAALENQIYGLAGAVFNIASNKQLADVVFGKLGLPVLRRTKTGPSTDQEVLEKLAREHPLPAAVIELRQLAKLKGTYLDALPLLVSPRDGRVHTTFNQATAATGRLSSSDPNLQNIPTRTELGKRIRRAFTADAGAVLISADYNQIELRILAHFSKDPVLTESFVRQVDIHTQTAAEVFGVPPTEVTKEMRNAAKAINFGIAYGLSAFGLSQRLELPPKEAQAIIDRYFARYQGVRNWLDATIEGARREGAVSTLFGRRRLLPEIRAKNMMVRQGAERMAVNTPIQGTAADLIKRAMLRADASLRAQGHRARMTLQVHDELVFEAPQEEAEAVAQLAKEAMFGAGELSVPLVVSVGIDRNWAEAH